MSKATKGFARKLVEGLSGIILAATAGCASANYNYGSTSRLYLMGPHGEPSPVLATKGSPEPRSLMWEVYKTESGNILVLRDYENSRIGTSQYKEYKLTYAKYPDGKVGLTLLPVKVGIQKIDYSPKAAENPGKEVEPSLPSP